MSMNKEENPVYNKVVNSKQSDYIYRRVIICQYGFPREFSAVKIPRR